MATVRILLCILCFAALGSSWGTDQNVIGYGLTYQNQDHARISHAEQGRKKMVAIAQKEVEVQEHHENSSPRIDQYNAYVGLHKVAWCASFLSWCYGQAGYPQPRTAWSPALFPKNRLAQDPVAGRIIGIYFPELKRVAHCGIVEWTKGNWVGTIEGNTNLNGSREGTGVYRRLRHKRTIYCYADWIGEGGKR